MNIMQLPKEYQPEMWTIAKDHIYAAISAIQIGLENTEELLVDHEEKVGRTTRKNRLEAERLEKELDQMKSTLIGLQKLSGNNP
ncbi:MAG: hypothetical protein EOM84_03135 [Sphingobacteriia bacterium]|nr:hypothetical protein [Sphingobacteriia bacterium]